MQLWYVIHPFLPSAHLQLTAAGAFGRWRSPGVVRRRNHFHLAAVYLWVKNISGWDFADLQQVFGTRVKDVLAGYLFISLARKNICSC